MPKRVYFAFHYQDVIDFRANVVRNHNSISGVEKAGYFDASIWEESKKRDPTALKRLINSELEYTSVTAVLIGTDTWSRRWVRYEVFKSFERGNKIIGVHINGIAGKDQTTKVLGPDPFNNMGLEINSDGTKATPTVWSGSQWVYYEDLPAFAATEKLSTRRGQHLRLTAWCRTYDWVSDSGYQNFSGWLDSA